MIILNFWLIFVGNLSLPKNQILAMERIKFFRNFEPNLIWMIFWLQVLSLLVRSIEHESEEMLAAIFQSLDQRGDKVVDSMEFKDVTPIEGQLLTSNDGSSKPSDFDGEYTLVSCDENYPEYLKAMGVPPFIIPHMLAKSENLTVKLSEKGGELTFDRGAIRSLTLNFTFNKMRSFEYGQGSTMWSICTLEEPNVISCETEEREKGLYGMMSKLIFSKNGMINERSYQGIDTKKFYRKESSEKDDIITLSNSPTSDDEDMEGSGVSHA